MSPHRNFAPFALILALLFSLLPAPLLARTEPTLLAPVQQTNSSAAPYVTYHPGTGQVSFMRFAAGQEYQVAAATTQSATEVAYAFLEQYGKAFGVQNPRRDLTVRQASALADGRTVTRFQQTYNQVPVIGGELIVHNRGASVLSANGELAPEQKVDTSPTISGEDAQIVVLQSTAKHAQMDASALTTSAAELWLYNPVLLDDRLPNVNQLVWRVTVHDETRRVNEWVLVDAHSGLILFQAPLSMGYKNRVVYDHANNTTLGLPGMTPIRTENRPAAGIADVDLVYDYMGDFYDFLQSSFGRDSYDNAGAPLVGVVRVCFTENCPYNNAFWDGQQLVFGESYAAADDVVAHELSHALIEHTANLFYSYQSGAINESLADLFGEFIDQTNGAGNDAPAVKWQMGENTSSGAIRNMANPPIYDDPDRMLSANYSCDESDQGGVHTNSGVNNKAAFLLVDGGAFNNHTITGMGLAKTAQLYYEALTNHLTSSSSYMDLADALIQASISLNFSTAEQQTVADVVEAVEMKLGQCNPPVEQPLCPTGQSAQLLFWDDMEHLDSGNWRAQSIVGRSNWFYPSTDNDAPAKANVRNAASGLQSLWGDDHDEKSDSVIAMTRSVTLPANAWLAFRHMWDFETGSDRLGDGPSYYDGGVVEYSTDNGISWQDARNLFSTNGYVGQIITTTENPLGGRQAFVDSSRGFLLSKLNLSTLAPSSVRFRFRVGTDSGVGHWGWFVDDVQFYTCAAGNTAPYVAAIPRQTLQQNGQSTGQIDLWSYAIDMQDPAEVLTYTLASSAPISAGVSLDDNRYLNIAPQQGFIGSPTLSVLISDTGNLATTASVPIAVRDDRLVHLPVVLKQEPIKLPAEIYTVEETAINLTAPDANYCHALTMVAGNRYASLIKFNVADIPQRTIIQGAQLSLYLIGSLDRPTSTRAIGLYRVNAPWLACNVTWNTQPAVAEELGRLNIPHSSDQQFTYDVTGVVQGWINGQIPNMGLLLKEVGAANRDVSYREFVASSLTDFPPVLTIQYQNGVVVSQQLPVQAEHTEAAAEPYSVMWSPTALVCGGAAGDMTMCLAK